MDQTKQIQTEKKNQTDPTTFIRWTTEKEIKSDKTNEPNVYKLSGWIGDACQFRIFRWFSVVFVSCLSRFILVCRNNRSIFHRQNAIPNKDWIDDGVQHLCPDLNEIENHHTDLIPCLSFFAFFSHCYLGFFLYLIWVCSIFLATISIWWMQQNGKFVVFSLSLSFSSIFLSFSRTCARDTISSAWRLRVLVWNDANSLATFASFEKFSFVTSWKQMEKFQLLIFTAQINKMYEGRKKNK